mmetsp:Transcript_31519/g.72834  ORF Transcript_31519/g.72834 Transcript_31519/m.72834 type:complete len:202 (-) Transcript_31519:994-1599(-)
MTNRFGPSRTWTERIQGGLRFEWTVPTHVSRNQKPKLRLPAGRSPLMTRSCQVLPSFAATMKIPSESCRTRTILTPCARNPTKTPPSLLEPSSGVTVKSQRMRSQTRKAKSLCGQRQRGSKPSPTARRFAATAWSHNHRSLIPTAQSQGMLSRTWKDLSQLFPTTVWTWRTPSTRSRKRTRTTPACQVRRGTGKSLDGPTT